MDASTASFGAPFVDVDEWRDTPRRHRYVHGGFEDSNTRFSFYLPPADLYGGRLLQFLSGGAGGDENFLGAGIWFAWAFDIAFDEIRSVLIESNQGHFSDEGTIGTSGDLELFGASAACAEYAKVVAEEMYGTAPHHSYVWGGSGGGLRSICCIEHRPDVWDGAASFAIGEASGSSLPLSCAYWWLYCRDRLPEICDAMEPGGSGDPFATLTDDERHALAAVLRAGWPRGGVNQLWSSASWMFGMAGLQDGDPTYLDDFWSRPGYLGHDHPERLASVVVDETCTVTATHDGPGPGQLFLPRLTGGGGGAEDAQKGSRFGVEVDAVIDDPNRMFMVRATVLTGAAAGRHVYVDHQDGVLVGERMTVPDLFDGVQVGDQVRLDNRDLVAFAHRWMYDVNLERWAVKDPATGERRLAPEFRGLSALLVDGRPVFPQRTGRVIPASMSGRVDAKLIHFAGTHDAIVPPPSVGHYHRLVRDHHGDRIDDHYRLWWVENSAHGDETLLPYTTSEHDPGVWRSRIPKGDGINREALLSLVRWVEDGTPPSPTTSYRYTDDSGLVLAPTAAERGGVQPVVRAEANGSERADVAVGEAVAFTGLAEQPPGTGTFVWARWDFEGVGDFSFEHELEAGAAAIKVEATHSFERPGTYFASFRAGARRDGVRDQGFAMENGARVRVVVR